MQAVQTALKSRAGARRDRVRVLIADQDALIRDALATLLRRAGYAAHAVATVDEAMQAGQRTDWDCLVADLDLPDTGGLELYSRLLFQGRVRLPVVFLATWPTVSLELALREAAWIRLLRRPCAFPDLLAALERCLGATRTP